MINVVEITLKNGGITRLSADDIRNIFFLKPNGTAACSMKTDNRTGGVPNIQFCDENGNVLVGVDMFNGDASNRIKDEYEE